MKITSIAQLKHLSEDEDGLDCFISLAGGAVRSSKHIHYTEDDKLFYILNENDGTEQHLTEAELMDEELTNVGAAIAKRALITY
jgi:hypothetical protein